MVLATRDAPALIDMQEYHTLATSLAQGRGYASAHGPTAFREPLYPGFLALVYRLAGTPSVLAARVAQAILGGVDVALAAAAATALGWPEAALPTAWIVALYPDRLLYASYLHREALLGPLWLIQLIAFASLRASPGPRRAALAGLSVAAGALCNAVLLATSFVHTLSLLTRPTRRALAAASVVWVVAVASLTPWAYRNLKVLGHWVWIDTKGGNALWEGNNEGWLQGKAEMEIRQAQWDQMAGMSEVEADRFARSQALRFIRAHPDQALYLWWRKALQFWRLELLFFFYYKQGYWGHLPVAALVTTAVVILPVFPLLVLGACAGVITGWRDRGTRIALALILAHCAACSVFIGGFRYHYPVVPALASLAVLGWRRRRLLRGRALALWVVSALCFSLNFVDHLVANADQIRALLGRGGSLSYSDTRSWMKRGIF